MSKHKVGDKFIINIKEVLESEKGTLYRADYNTLTFDDYGLDGLQKHDALQERLELIDELKKAEYNKGLNDAWELARKIFTLNRTALNNAFDFEEKRSVFDELDVQIALEKLKAYEEAQNEIKVGDVVTYAGERCLVLDTKGDRVVVLTGDCCVLEWHKCDVEKTGKHIDIKSILESIGE